MSQRSKLRLFPRVTPTQRRDADLFLAELLGRRGGADLGPPGGSSSEALTRRRGAAGSMPAAARFEADQFWADLIGRPAGASRQPAWLPGEQQPPAPVVQIDQLGTATVLRGAAVVPIWALPPGTTVAAATPPAGPAPVPAFGIVDLLIQTSADPLVSVSVAAPAAPAVPIAPAVTSNSLPLVRGAGGLIRICFAVPTAGGPFVGTLRLAVRRGAAAPGTALQVDLPIRVAAGARAGDLAVFLVPHASASVRYAWTKLKVIRQGDPARVIAGAAITGKVLRDNLTLRSPNRKIALVTDAGGFAAFDGRNIIAYPIDWPLIFNVTEPGAVVRGHLVRLRAVDIHDNGAPHEPAPVPTTRTPDARLAGRRIMLDAGHGVVYGLATQRRSQEWFVAHQICERVAELLQATHGVAAADIFHTRTAGFGLIDPGTIAQEDAPETGGARYTFDLPGRRVQARIPAVTLKDISDLLLVRHTGAADAAQAVTVAERNSLLTVAFVAAVEARLNGELAPARRVRPGSIRWDATADNYLFTREPTAGGAGTDLPLPIRTTDVFPVTAAMMTNLADRSARWSVRKEIGSGPAAAGTRPAFTTAARTAMRAAGAVDYMRERILRYVNVAAPHAYLDHGVMGWGPTARVDYMNANDCHLYISVHENAAGGTGGMSLVSAATAGAARPPDDQIRLGKVFLKHLDPFDVGLRQGGIAREVRPATMLGATNTRRARYAYLEIEFMDAIDPADANRYRYQAMVDPPFIERVAQQIVAAAVEALLAPQPMADVTLNGEYTAAGGGAIW